MRKKALLLRIPVKGVQASLTTLLHNLHHELVIHQILPSVTGTPILLDLVMK